MGKFKWAKLVVAMGGTLLSVSWGMTIMAYGLTFTSVLPGVPIALTGLAFTIVGLIVTAQVSQEM